MATIKKAVEILRESYRDSDLGVESNVMLITHSRFS